MNAQREPIASPLLCPFGVAETLSHHLDAQMFRFASRNRPMTHYVDRVEAQGGAQ